MITVLTLAVGDKYRKALDVSLQSKKEWCERHGYQFILGGDEYYDRKRPVAWSKARLVTETLSQLPEGDFIFLSDADVLITNSTLRLEDIVLPLLPENKDLLMTFDAGGNLNSGNMLMRNTPWLSDFWKRIDLQNDLTNHIWWENAAIIKLLLTNTDDLNHVKIINEHWKFNAYIQGISGQRLWQAGDLLVHFAGITRLKKLEHLQRAFLSKAIYGHPVPYDQWYTNFLRRLVYFLSRYI